MTETNLPILETATWEYLKWNAFLSKEHKLLYVATPKVACTSLKWWFASILGVEGAIRAYPGSEESTPELTVHDTFHKIAPLATGLDPDSLTIALSSNDFFRFALVRNPYKRIFSAWQSKLMLHEPLQVGPYTDFDFITGEISCKEDIKNSFEKFLEHLYEKEAPNFIDIHWTPQSKLLRPDIINYTKIIKIENKDELNREISLRNQEISEKPFSEKRANESLIPYDDEYISKKSEGLIRNLYSEDFEIFEYDHEVPKTKERLTEEQLAIALNASSSIKEKNHRIAQIRKSHSESIYTLEQSRINEKNRLENEIAILRVKISEFIENDTIQNGKIETLGNDLEARYKEISALENKLAESMRNANLLSSSLEEKIHEIEYKKSRISELSEEVRKLTEYSTHWQNVLFETLTSTSWKITRPFRRLKCLLSGSEYNG